MKVINKPGFEASTFTRKGALAATSLVLAGAALFTGVGQAQAASADITRWDTYSDPFRCSDDGGGLPVFFCLYYSPWAEGALWKATGNPYWNMSSQTEYPILDGNTFEADSYGSAGAGQQVVNNAASVESDRCSVAVYNDYGYYGDQNWVAGGRGGNLTWYMRNHEKSIHRWCPSDF